MWENSRQCGKSLWPFVFLIIFALFFFGKNVASHLSEFFIFYFLPMAIRSKKRVKRQHGVASDNLPSQHHVYEEEQPEEEPLAERKRSHKVAKMASIFCGYSYYSSSIVCTCLFGFCVCIFANMCSSLQAFRSSTKISTYPTSF